MNSEHLMPFDSIATNLIAGENTPFPYLSGTGFFVYFPPFEDQIFYITARHCFIHSHEGNFNNKLLISYGSYKHPENFSLGNIPFSEYIEISEKNESDLDDILIFAIDNQIDSSRKKVLLNRAIKLSHIDDVNFMIELISSSRNYGKVRTIGFPNKSDTELKYDENYEIESIRLQPRGFNGWLEKDSNDIYKIVDTNWKEDSLNGFSGAPILVILSDNQIKVIGILIAGSNQEKFAKFISINNVTQAIAQFLCNKGYAVPIEE